MNTKNAVIVIAALVLALAGQAWSQRQSQIRYGGYLAAEYIKGQPDSGYPHGTIDNLLAGFLADGQVGQKFHFTVEARALGVDAFELVQAWAGFMASEAFSLRAGLFLVPFGAWNTASRPHETVLIRTPLNLEHLYPRTWREIGVLAEGRVGVLTYAAYLGSGLAEASPDALPVEANPYVQRFRDNNANLAKGGRLGLIFSEGIRGGVSYYTGKYDDQDMRDLTLEGADLAWVTPQWEVHGEYTKAFLENPQPFERGESEGWFVWACMSFRSFQPVGSYQKLKFTDAYHNGGIALDQSRWTAGLRVVLSSALFVKFEHDWNKEKGTALKNNQWQAQLGLSF